jgi:hypothetical protein
MSRLRLFAAALAVWPIAMVKSQIFEHLCTSSASGGCVLSWTTAAALLYKQSELQRQMAHVHDQSWRCVSGAALTTHAGSGYLVEQRCSDLVNCEEAQIALPPPAGSATSTTPLHSSAKPPRPAAPVPLVLRRTTAVAVAYSLPAGLTCAELALGAFAAALQAAAQAAAPPHYRAQVQNASCAEREPAAAARAGGRALLAAQPLLGANVLLSSSWASSAGATAAAAEQMLAAMSITPQQLEQAVAAEVSGAGMRSILSAALPGTYDVSTALPQTEARVVLLGSTTESGSAAQPPPGALQQQQQQPAPLPAPALAAPPRPEAPPAPQRWANSLLRT